MGNLVLHGVHSRPLGYRVEPGKSCFWVGGDIGRDDHQGRDGKFGLGEVGGCVRLSTGVQGALSLGRSASRQNLAFNGRSAVDTTYAVAEVLGNIPGTKLWPSAALLYQQGDVDARRGYLNAGTQDFSVGRPDVQTTALRLRLEWEGAANFGATVLTPYADVSHARTRIEGYAETGGGFPARFDGRRDNATEWRVGLDAVHALSATTKLLGRIEAAHRVQKTRAGASGTVLGLFDFNLPGEQLKRDWLRAGVGVETKVGPGKLAAMFNASTQGEAPSYWLNASYQVAF